MKLIAPDYYTSFQCIANHCKHNCCIGWEIDIDERTLSRYSSVKGVFGARLRENIVQADDFAYFRLGSNERCPFLNDENLCDIYIKLGEDALCTICTEHPRFRNDFSDRTELGLGLCCEAVAALICGKETKTELFALSQDDDDASLSFEEQQFFLLRKHIFEILQDRSFPVYERIQRVLTHFCAPLPLKTPAQWADVFLSLERLDDNWTALLQKLKETDFNAQSTSALPETALEQLAVYFIYRHLADGIWDDSFKERIAFCMLSVQCIVWLCATKGAPALSEIARMYSAEIEYSEDNTEALLSLLAPTAQ